MRDRTLIVIMFLALALGIFSGIVSAQPSGVRVAQVQNNQTSPTPAIGTEVMPPETTTTPPPASIPPPTTVPTPPATVPPPTETTPPPAETVPAPSETPAPTITPETPAPTTTPTPPAPSETVPTPSGSVSQPGGQGTAGPMTVRELPTTGIDLMPILVLGFGLTATGMMIYRKRN